MEAYRDSGRRTVSTERALGTFSMEFSSLKSQLAFPVSFQFFNILMHGLSHLFHSYGSSKRRSAFKFQAKAMSSVGDMVVVYPVMSTVFLPVIRAILILYTKIRF